MVEEVEPLRAELREAPALWLVDGFNVLNVAVLQGAERADFWGPGARARLLALVERFPGAPGVIVVFDGARPAESGREGAGPHSVFAPDADAWLLGALRAHGDPGRVAVVTADRRLAARARHRGARIVSPGEFVAACVEGVALADSEVGDETAGRRAEDARGRRPAGAS